MSSLPNYDSEFCGKLPIHLINTVQSYGALLVLERGNLQIVQVSENVEQLFHQPATALINTPISDHLDDKALSFLQQTATTDKIPQVWTIGDEQYLTLVHAKEKYILAEVELTPHHKEQQRSFVSIFQEIKYSMSLIQAAGDTVEVCKIAARELQRLSGFDKVMIYRFDEEWNGTVIAEIIQRGVEMESYFEFTFPASDIPRQARELYLKNPYRFIPDRNYQPVGLYPVMNPLTHSFIDLSDCNVRGVAAVHLEYLANMGVTASMSTRILHNDKLWGLIACHHRTAKYLPFEVCSVFELLSQVVSARILSLQNKEKHDFATQVQETYTRLVEQVYDKNDIIEGLLKGNTSLLHLFNAQGAAMIRDEKIFTVGKVPDNDTIRELIFWLHTRRHDKVLHTEHLSAEFDKASDYMDVASGLLAMPVNPARDEYVLLFRTEVKKVIDWSGDPSERIVYEKDEKNYHPRNSFKQWRQIVSGASLPWKEEELTAGAILRSFLYEFTNK
ncbi:MAG TPA: GAF domain-containing protein [Puia sp.]|nr:GAF domain-containing protein [Puia sp.]